MLESMMLVHRSRIDRLEDVPARAIFSSLAAFKHEALFADYSY